MTSIESRSTAALVLFLAVMPAPGTGASEMEDLEIAIPITKVIEAQQRSWNDGDIAGYMEHYWKSDDLTFSSGGETTRGWQATKERYDRRYGDRDAMGRLTFSELEVYPLSAESALVLGRWRLDRKADAPEGNFSLVFRKLDGAWVIVHDHTSLTPPEE